MQVSRELAGLALDTAVPGGSLDPPHPLDLQVIMSVHCTQSQDHGRMLWAAQEREQTSTHLYST